MIEAAEFEYLRGYLQHSSAIVLDEDKRYLAESRLASLVNQEGFPTVQKLLETVRRQPEGRLHRKILDAMTNNETWFFRDFSPFEALRTQIIPEMVARRAQQRQLTIWSAAASSGQEIYSTAMLIHEHFPQLLGWNLSLVATDLSTRVLERARRGRYSKIEVNRGLPARLLAKYFQAHGDEFELVPHVREMVTFREMNLAAAWLQPIYADVIFLRNVLIYFDVPTKRAILARVRPALRPDGYLVLGSAETTLNLDDNFERVQIGTSSWYRLRGNRAACA